MKKIFIPLLVIGFLSCSPKEENPDGGLSRSETAIMEESSELNIQEIKYEGTFKGKINGTETELKLNAQNFEWTENGRRFHGNWTKVNDATTIELNSDNGKLPFRYLAYADENSWMILTDSMTIPDKEQFLKRIPD